MSDSEKPIPPHKRTASRLLKRITSTKGDVPTLSTGNGQSESGNASMTSSPVDGSGMLQPNAPPRVSTNAPRPHLSTTMSNTGIIGRTNDVGPATATPSSATQGASIEQSVRLFKVFEALRSGDTAAIAKATKGDGDSKLESTTTLHLAVQCAEQPVLEYVLSQPGTDVNARDRDGNTPLHIAANLGRVPVVKLLLEQPDINDSITNYQGKTALDLARNPDIFQQLQLARSVFVDRNVRKVHQLVGAGDYDGLEQLLGDSRVRAALDVNGPELATDPATTEHGGSLLHEAARKRDLKLAQMLLLNGADPFRRDRKGKLPQDVTKDDRTRAILKRSPAAQAAQRSIQEKTILGESAQASGSASTDGGPGGKESREMKGYLRKWTNYTSGYKLRWFVLEDGVLSYYKHQDDAGSACRGAINMRIAKLHMDPKDKLLFEIHGKSSVKYNLKANHQVEAKRWYWALNNAIQWAKDEAKEEQRRQQQETMAIRDARNEQLERMKTREADVAQSGAGLVASSAVGSAPGTSSPLATSTMGDQASAYEASDAGLDLSRGLSRTNTAATNIEGDLDDDDDEYGDDASSHEVRPASKDAFSITAQSAKLQLDLLEQVSAALQAQSRNEPEMSFSHPTVTQALASYDTAVGNLKGLIIDLLRISRDHEAYWQYRLEREQNIRRLWEDSMARVAQEQEELENRIGASEDKRKRTKRALKEALEGGAASTPGSMAIAREEEQQDFVNHDKRRPTIAELTHNQVSDDETEDEEEFFDAVDAGQVEVERSLPPMSPPANTDAGPESAAKDIGESTATSSADDKRGKEIAKSFKGYEDGLRKRLKLDADNRPKASLWAVLKSMIGKDMTRMTLPVSFNEPTSLLYRTAEDMEYAEMLNIAADRPDSTERLVYVAGFASSIFASTIGRVAKPFNPLLGETFEYCRPDLGYRFFIEQVSHHPPISAAIAQSPKWDYYGEANVKSKFYGKSFEFNHLGTWYLHLRTPDGEEMYTWKKVNSSVVGIITGNPTVDNYGPMEVKNWRTGEVCHLDFKPKGWKASSAYQVVGKVVDAKGVTRWSIGGRWNDKIYARLTPGYEAPLDDLTKYATEKALLVWEANPRPSGIPFNVTPFVVTLNALPDSLKPYIPPTDSRLRPDQRAMEEGEYDLAADEKSRVEDGQRARRRAREAKGEEFRPRWFKKAKHPVSGGEYWKFDNEYWDVREKVVEGEAKWEGLEEIF